jgi:hypothetical protein
MENNHLSDLNSVIVNGKILRIFHAIDGSSSSRPPIKRRTANINFRSVIEDQLDFGDHIELDKPEMVRARSQLSNAKSKAKKNGKSLPYGFAFRTEIKDKLYLLYKIVVCLGVLGYLIYDEYSDRHTINSKNSAEVQRSIHPPTCVCPDCTIKHSS